MSEQTIETREEQLALALESILRWTDYDFNANVIVNSIRTVARQALEDK